MQESSSIFALRPTPPRPRPLPVQTQSSHQWSFANSTGVGAGDDSPRTYHDKLETDRVMDFACRYWYHMWHNRGQDELTPPYISMKRWNGRLARMGIIAGTGTKDDVSSEDEQQYTDCDQSDSE